MTNGGRGGGTRKATQADARLLLAKACEFRDVAKEALDEDRRDAAVGNAVQAGILAADAISAEKLGSTWKGDHKDAMAHVERVPKEGKAAARDLGRLLPLKSRAQYDPIPSTEKDAKNAVKAADRLVARAERVLITGDN